LTDPNSSSPANAEAAVLFDSTNFISLIFLKIEDRDEYLRRVQECVISSWIAPLPTSILMKSGTQQES